MDSVDKHTRSRMMACIHANDTKPEMIVRHYLFKQGFRYRLHVHTMPGSPDIVLRKYRTAIFVNGCFWHGHDGCKYHTIPKTNTEFWTAKIERNKERDAREAEELKKMGWNVIRIWECQLKPKVRDEYLNSLSLALNQALLLEYQDK
jgi:DNA mismatch endonuclease (patch repair protein)